MTEEKIKEKIVYKTPPNTAFIMGILAGVTIAAIVGMFMMYSYVGDEVASGNTNSGTVAAADDTVDPTPTPTPTAPTVADIEVRSDDYIRGDKDAPVTLVEWSDFECSFCGRAAPTMEKILEEYDGQVRLIYRHFPLSFHTTAQKAAEAAECAGDQGKFWEMHDVMFENQSALQVADLKGYAVDLGLKATTFNDCLDNGTHEQKVKDDFTEGTQVGVQGTPATFVNGTMVSGAQPFESFAAAIDAALAE